MSIIKCPRCEINFIHEEDNFCIVCRREMKGEAPKEDIPEMCIECGENPIMPGEEICLACYNERKLADDLIIVEGDEDDSKRHDDEDNDEDISLSDIDSKEDIPDTELEVIHKELGIDEIELDVDDEIDTDDEDDYL